MSIDRVGQFIEFRGQDGLKTLVRISAIQIITESDPSGDETQLTVANRSFLVRAPLDELREALIPEERFRVRYGGRVS